MPEGGTSEYAATPTTAEGSHPYVGGDISAGGPQQPAQAYASPYGHTPQAYPGDPSPSAVPRMPQVAQNLSPFQSGCYGFAAPSSALWV